MTEDEYKQKASYLRTIGHNALADDIEELIQRIKSLKLEEKRLKTIIYGLLGAKK